MSFPPPAPESSPIDPAASRKSAWQRYIAHPIRSQLRQGCSPEQIALTIALGTTLGVFPVIGCTTVLCTAAAYFLRLNQPVIQVVNYFLYPIQIALIFVFIRIGEHLYGAEPLEVSLPDLLGQFRAAPLGFAREFAMTLVHCVSAWLVLAPVMAGLLYAISKPLLVAATNRMRALKTGEPPRRSKL